MHIAISKTLATFALLASALIGISIPIIVRRKSDSDGSEYGNSKGQAIMCICNCLAAGVIMAMSFLHIFPESVEQCFDANLFIKIKENKLNLAFLLILVSFSVMLFIERVITFGRTPCSSEFNKCKINTNCCTSKDEESLVAREIKSFDTDNVIIPQEPTNKSSGTRYKHSHSHILATIKNILCPICDCNGLCITLALFVHSVFEGLVVGLEENDVHVFLIAFGIFLHKWAAGMALASFVIDNPKATMFVMFGIFCIGSPLGVLIGSLILDSNIRAIAILNSIAVGTLIYVGFEIIVHELFCEIKCKKTALYKWLSFMGGSVLIFCTILLDFSLSTHSH